MPSPTTNFETGFLASTSVKEPCTFATTGAISLAGLQTVDGVSVTAGMRGLVKNQGDGTENGIYVASAGTWQRAVDFNSNSDVVKGTRIFITDGSANAGLEYYVTSANPVIVGTSALTFAVALTTGGSTVPQSRVIATTEGIQGGGNLSADRTFRLDVSGLGTLPSSTPDSGDFIPLYDISASTHVKVTWGNLSSAFITSSRQINTASGLTGGGDLSANRTIALNINALSSPASVDSANDYVLLYKTSSGDHRKVAPDQLFEGVTVDAENLTGGPFDAAIMPNSGVSAGSYGNASTVATFSVDQYGRLTSATNAAISITFGQISDGPGSLTGQASKFLQVNAMEDGFDFAAGASVSVFTDLGDVPGAYTGSGGQFLRVKMTEDGLEFEPGASVATFTDLTDTPSSYSGSANYLVKVNSGSTALEFSATVPTNSVATAGLQDGAVTLAKLANLAQGTLIGRQSSGSGVPQAITVSTGLAYSGGNLRLDVDGLTAETSIDRTTDTFPLWDGSASALRKATIASMIGAGLAQIANLADPNADRIIFWDDSAGAYTFLTVGTGLSISGTTLSASGSNPVIPIIAACSDETTALTTGAAKITFRMPFAFTLSEVRASLSTAQASGNIITVDINEGGTTILSTKLTIDNNERTSTTAATPAVISDTSLADDAEITIDIDQVGASTVAKGLKVYLIGSKT